MSSEAQTEVVVFQPALTGLPEARTEVAEPLQPNDEAFRSSNGPSASLDTSQSLNGGCSPTSRLRALISEAQTKFAELPPALTSFPEAQTEVVVFQPALTRLPEARTEVTKLPTALTSIPADRTEVGKFQQP